MKKTLFLALLITTASIYGQSEQNYSFDWNHNDVYNEPIAYFPKEKVEAINFTVINKRGKESKYKRTYNSEGRIKSLLKIDKHGEEVPLFIHTYEDDGNKLISKRYKRGKLKSTLVRKYQKFDNQNIEGHTKMIEAIKTKANGKIKYKDIWNYNENGCIQSSFRYKRKGKVHRKWVYEYYDLQECKRSKTKLMKGNGKIVTVWNHDCKEEGEQLEPKKDETRVCKYEETTPDYLIKVREEFDEKGRVVKSIYKYRRSDTAIVEHKRLDGNDNLRSFATYDPDINRLLTFTTFNKKGEKRYESIYSYQDGQVASKVKKHKGKLREKVTYEYESSLLVERKEYNKKDEVKGIVKLSY